MTANRCLNKNKIILFIILFIIIGSVGIYGAIKSEYVQKTVFYPLLYTDKINQFAVEKQLNPWFVAAIIRNESGFKPEALSSSGAMGLMQIMPETAGWIAKKKEVVNFHNEMLKDPELNISFGCWYLSDLWQEFKDEKIVIASYNAGRGQVRSWIEEGKWDGVDVDAIPFQETREYVKKVLYDKERYKQLYKDFWHN